MLSPLSNLSSNELNLLKLDLNNAINVKKIIELYAQSSKLNRNKLEKKLLKKINSQNITLIHRLAYLDNINLLNVLLSLDALYNIRDAAGLLPIHYAQSNALRFILEKDATKCYPLGYLQMHQLDSKFLTPLAVWSVNDDIYNLMECYQKTSFINYIKDNNRNTTSVVSNHEWEEASFCSAAAWISEPTGQIVTLNEQKVERRLCSGVYLGYQYFLTAGPYINEVCQVPTNYRISFNYQYSSLTPLKRPNGPIKEQICKILSVEAQGKCHETSQGERVDFALFKIDKSFGTAAKLSINILNNEEEIIIAHHPHGLPKKVSYGQITRQLNQMNKLGHDAHTLKGSSGSPIGNKKTMLIYGIHVEDEEVMQTDHIGVTINKIANHLRLKKPSVFQSLIKLSIFGESPPLVRQQQNPLISNNSVNQYDLETK